MKKNFPTEASWVNFAANMAKKSPTSGIIYLSGDLGAGKTVFSRGFIQALDPKLSIKSPTFTLIEPYTINGVKIYHFDLYRLTNPEELAFMGIEDYFSEPALCLIEWPEKGKGFLPQCDITIEIYFAPIGRDIKIESGSELGKQWLEKL